MASTITEMLRRRMGARGSSIDWESIARGLLTNSLSGVVELPDDITLLRPYCFYNCYHVTGIIARGVTDIGESAFNYMINLESLELDTITNIRANAFSNCRKLETPIVISDSVTALPQTVFFSCYKIPYIDVGTGVTSIGNQCFRYLENCQYVIMRPTTPPTLGTNNFVNSSAATYPIYVPDASVNDYKAESGWSSFASRIKPISEMGG